MKDLIEALTILSKYGDPRKPTICAHDELFVMINYEDVSAEDRKRLAELSFNESEHGTFSSYRFGSA